MSHLGVIQESHRSPSGVTQESYFQIKFDYESPVYRVFLCIVIKISHFSEVTYLHKSTLSFYFSNSTTLNIFIIIIIN